MMKEFAVFLSTVANRVTDAGHHSPISAFTEGTIFGSWRRITAPVQTVVAKGHWSVMWSRVPSRVPHRGHMMCVGNPLLCLRSAVQHLRRSASHACILNFSGAKKCQTCVAPGSAEVPWKRFRYAVLEEKTPSAVHFHRKELASSGPR
jgi:hypothetical protein